MHRRHSSTTETDSESAFIRVIVKLRCSYAWWNNQSIMPAPIIYDFRLDAWKPHTLPMARLAAYLEKLAVIFGHREHVHFLKVRVGSAISEIHLDETEAPKIQARLKLVGAGNGADDAVRAVRYVNDMLREDNSSATLRVKGGAKIIEFPGCKTPLADEAVVHETGELIGTVIRVGGKDDTVPLQLQGIDGTSYNCNTTRPIARDLAHHLFGDLVQVHGMGKWRRTPERDWEQVEFKIKGWEPIEQVSVAKAVEGFRAVSGSGWNAMANPQAELKKMREA